jgi:hypothetical protein
VCVVCNEKREDAHRRFGSTKAQVYELVGVEPKARACFYTAGLNEDIGKMEESARFGLRFTPYLKARLSLPRPLLRCDG